MTEQEKIAFKQKLKQAATEFIEQRIANAEKATQNAQLTANAEEKSSAGDKYETGRAMGHLETDMFALQVAQNIKDLASIHDVDVDKIYSNVTAGAFIKCVGVSFFIAAGLGKQHIDGQHILFLSPQAPLAKTLSKKKSGDRFLFKTVSTLIIEIF